MRSSLESRKIALRVSIVLLFAAGTTAMRFDARNQNENQVLSIEERSRIKANSTSGSTSTLGAYFTYGMLDISCLDQTYQERIKTHLKIKQHQSSGKFSLVPNEGFSDFHTVDYEKTNGSHYGLKIGEGRSCLPWEENSGKDAPGCIAYSEKIDSINEIYTELYKGLLEDWDTSPKGLIIFDSSSSRASYIRDITDNNENVADQFRKINEILGIKEDDDVFAVQLLKKDGQSYMPTFLKYVRRAASHTLMYWSRVAAEAETLEWWNGLRRIMEHALWFWAGRAMVTVNEVAEGLAKNETALIDKSRDCLKELEVPEASITTEAKKAVKKVALRLMKKTFSIQETANENKEKAKILEWIDKLKQKKPLKDGKDWNTIIAKAAVQLEKSQKEKWYSKEHTGLMAYIALYEHILRRGTHFDKYLQKWASKEFDPDNDFGTSEDQDDFFHQKRSSTESMHQKSQKSDSMHQKSQKSDSMYSKNQRSESVDYGVGGQRSNSIDSNNLHDISDDGLTYSQRQVLFMKYMLSQSLHSEVGQNEIYDDHDQNRNMSDSMHEKSRRSSSVHQPNHDYGHSESSNSVHVHDYNHEELARFFGREVADMMRGPMPIRESMDMEELMKKVNDDSFDYDDDDIHHYHHSKKSRGKNEKRKRRDARLEDLRCMPALFGVTGFAQYVGEYGIIQNERPIYESVKGKNPNKNMHVAAAPERAQATCVRFAISQMIGWQDPAGVYRMGKYGGWLTSFTSDKALQTIKTWKTNSHNEDQNRNGPQDLESKMLDIPSKCLADKATKNKPWDPITVNCRFFTACLKKIVSSICPADAAAAATAKTQHDTQAKKKVE